MDFNADLILPPDDYRYQGQKYHCAEERVYRFGCYPLPMVQKIVYAGDTVKLLESLSWCHVHGYKDNGLSYCDALAIAQTRKLSMTCQPICTFTVRLLNHIGVLARTVSFITLDKPNRYSDGHRMLEFNDGSRWILVDMTTRRLFKVSGEYISAKDLIHYGMPEVELEKFSEAPVLSYNDLKLNGYDFTFLTEDSLVREEDLRIWYTRICQSISYP